MSVASCYYETYLTNLYSCVDANKSDASSEAGVNVKGAFGNIWARMVTNNVLRRFNHWCYIGIDKLIGVRSLSAFFKGGMV
jgi:hypothetical protein